MGRAIQSDRQASRLPRSGNAVLAYAAGLDLAEVAPFVRSLRAVFSGQIILAVDHRPTLIAWLSTHDVEAVVVDRSRPWRRMQTAARWAFFGEDLAARPEVRHVILVDVDQVVFQSDPFRDMPVSLEFIEDVRAAPNAVATRDLVGEALARKISASAPVLAGVIGGPRACVVRFCQSMQRLSAAARSGAVGSISIDAAVCTVIARLGLDGAEVVPDLGRVAIACGSHQIRNGLIVNFDGGASAMVHGYGRYASLASHVADLWGVAPAKRSLQPAAAWVQAKRADFQAFVRGLAARDRAARAEVRQRDVAPTTARSRRSSAMIVAASSPSAGRVERAASESA